MPHLPSLRPAGRAPSKAPTLPKVTSREISLVVSHLTAHGQGGTEKWQGSFAPLVPCMLQKDPSRAVLAEVVVPTAWGACAAHRAEHGGR